MTIRNPKANYTAKRGFSLSMYTDEELMAIHLASVEVLWFEGMHVGSKEAMDLFEDGGATVNRSEGTVRIPQYMIEEAIRSAPSTMILAGRNRKRDVVLDRSRVNFTTFGAGVNWLDLETGNIRDTLKADLATTALLADYLPGVDVYSHSVTARDMPKESVDLHEAEAFLSNTTKHCMHIDLTCRESVFKYIEMGAAIVGGKDELRKHPVISALTCPQSPLTLHEECCDIIINLSRAGVPVNVLSMAMSGATTPVTIAGTLVVHNCEVLSGIVLSQLASKGAPVMYGSSTTSFDLKTATAPVGSPEMGLLNAGVAALAQYYNLPSYVGGTQADSKCIDAQTGHEKTVTSMMAALAGANVIYGLGMLELGMTFSPAQLVIDDEIANMVKRIVRGVDVSDETLAVDLIKKVGGGQGKHYLMEKHTLDNMRIEQAQPRLFDRKMRMNWEEDGSQDVAVRATNKAKEIIAEYKPEPLDADVKAALRKIVESAEK